MNQEAVEARKAYYKQWRAKSKEKIRKYNQSYWKKKAEQVKKQRNER